MKGTAIRTENPIISDTPAPVLRSAAIDSAMMTKHMGPAISPNKPHPFTNLLFKNKSRFMF
jgi:hypothetical protein